jgi:putative PIN family toxin of toxin-antitoxin system
MRILIDTNILISAALFPSSETANVLIRAVRDHSFVICTYVLEEAQSVFARKFPQKIAHLDVFFSKLAYELCYTPQVSEITPEMRDENDRPILQAAVDAEVDAILTGDKDFHALALSHPRILSPVMLMEMLEAEQ